MRGENPFVGCFEILKKSPNKFSIVKNPSARLNLAIAVVAWFLTAKCGPFQNVVTVRTTTRTKLGRAQVQGTPITPRKEVFPKAGKSMLSTRWGYLGGNKRVACLEHRVLFVDPISIERNNEVNEACDATVVQALADVISISRFAFINFTKCDK